MTKPKRKRMLLENLKMIAMDVDGTLVPHGGTISSRTKKILKLCSDRGIEVVLVTARPPRWLGPVIEALNMYPTAICANGAVTVNTKSFELIDMKSIDKEIAKKAMEEVRKLVPDVVFAAESKDYLRAEPKYEDLPEGVVQAEGLVPENRYETIKTFNSIDEILKEDVYKIVAETFELSADDFLQKAQGAVGSILNVTRSVHGRSYIEFGPLNLSKADTLSDYADSLNIESSQTIAFGDMPNDLEMLQWAGVGVAMGNAHQDVLNIADVVAPAASEDGIAVVIEQILNQKSGNKND